MTRTAWLFVAIAVCGCKSEADRSPAHAILGCYSIEESRDPRYPKGDRLCLLQNGIVSVTEGDRGTDAFEVTWTAPEGGFRAIVPPAQTKGVHVEFLVTPAGGDKLDFRVGETWMTVRLAARSERGGEEALEGLHACRACVDEVVRARGSESAPQTPLYSLRACSMFLRAVGGKCSALGIEGRAPPPTPAP
jgi:hypothetical protein